MSSRAMLIENKTWWIAHGENAMHFSVSEKGESLSTGQKYLEIFNNESEWADRVRELGGEPYPPEEDYDEWTEDEG